MLSRLSVSNLAVVEKAEADFAPGLNVLTGETGAGKSVLMGALGLVLGGRADASVVRDGAREARVEAVFNISASSPAIRELLSETGLPDCADGGELIVRRTVAANGAGRVWVNDSQTTVATLKRLGALLVDIHGPRANQQILDERFQRDALDAYGATPRAAYDEAWRALCAARDARDAFLASGESAEETDLLRYQIAEFEEAAVTADDEDLAERHAAAAHAEEIVGCANEITDALGGDGGAADRIERLRPVFASAARHFPEASEWAAEADRLAIGIEELSRTVADAVSRLDADPAAFEEMDARLGVVNRMKRKYGKGTDGTVAALLAVFEEKKARLASLENRGEALAKLERDVAAAESAARSAGAALSKRRAAAAAKIAKSVTKELRDLGFLKAGFSVSLEPAEPGPGGCDRVRFMFEPNPGESARALASIASSGETARVMLALKNVLAAHDAVDILVFDEIDANIGGETGRAVGAKMKSVAAHRQVIAITHLPQSAVFGDRHLVVSKSVSGGRTRTRIEEVTGEARVAEIARMLGGDSDTGVVTTHARELLKLAR